MKIFLETTLFKDEHFKPLLDYFDKDALTFEIDHECEILVGSFHTRKTDFFDQFPNIKLIVLLSSGYNHIDLTYMKHRNIKITNAKSVYDIQIAEDVISKMLYFNRELKSFVEAQEKHQWKIDKPLFELYQTQVLILGAGSIGSAIAKRLKAFDMEVIGYKRTYESIAFFDQIITSESELETYYKSCDYLVVALPLNDDTKYLINKEVFNLLKPSCVIINIGRGKIINQDDLIEALNENRLRGAGLDVCYPEPLPKDHALWDANHILITSHTASDSQNADYRSIKFAFDQVRRYLNDEKMVNIILDHQS